MSSSMICDDDSRTVNAERYVMHRMTAAEAEAFEDHFITCGECQGAVRFASAVAAGLEHSPVMTSKPPRRLWIWGGGGLALAAGLATVMLFRQEASGELVALGGVREPPTYLGVPVRGADASKDSLFEAAMVSYSTKRYGAAIEGLRGALAAGQDSVPAHFFLATSLLLSERAAEAVREYDRVLAHGEKTYRGEARYYRAKALLRLGRAPEALVELGKLTTADDVAYQQGRSLADSVVRARDRQ